MNKITKILLSVLIVLLSALVVPLMGYRWNTKTEFVTVQTAVRIAENVDKNSIEGQLIPIDFETGDAVEEMNQKMVEIECITDKKEWYIAYKKIIEEYLYAIDLPETIYDYFTEEELELLFHVVQAEIGDEYSFDQKCNVASVIFNRLDHSRFPDSLSEILVPDQFSTISNGRYLKVEVSDETILACEYAFSIERTAYDCLFFDSNNKLKYKFVFTDGAHNFYKLYE